MNDIPLDKKYLPELVAIRMFRLVTLRTEMVAMSREEMESVFPIIEETQELGNLLKAALEAGEFQDVYDSYEREYLIDYFGNHFYTVEAWAKLWEDVQMNSSREVKDIMAQANNVLDDLLKEVYEGNHQRLH